MAEPQSRANRARGAVNMIRVKPVVVRHVADDRAGLRHSTVATVTLVLLLVGWTAQQPAARRAAMDGDGTALGHQRGDFRPRPGGAVVGR